MQLSLYVRRGPTSGQLFPLSDQGVTLIGRNATNHVVLLDREVSANHCVIRPRRSGVGFLLIDARSRHGTLVNGRPVGKGLIGLGDTLSAGPFELEVVEAPADQPVSTPQRRAAPRPPSFEIAPRGWRKSGVPLPPASATVLGRAPFAHLLVDDTFASACHCLIALDPTDDARMPFVVDLHSSNGTYINRRPIHRKHLLPNEVLIIGQAQYRLRRLEGAEAHVAEPEVEIPPAPPRRAVVSTEALPPAQAAPLPGRQPQPPPVFAADTHVPDEEPLEPLEAAAPAAPMGDGEEPELVPIDDLATDLEAQLEAEAAALPADHGPPPTAPKPPAETPDEVVAPPRAVAVEDVLAPVVEEMEAPAPEPPAPAEPNRAQETVALPQPPKPRVQTTQPLVPQLPAVPRDTPVAEQLEAEAALAGIALDDTRSVEILPSPGPGIAPSPPTRLLAAGPDDYDEFFGFTSPPFLLTVDPDVFFDSQHHWDALDTLVRWLRTGPPVAVLFGEAGCGKSLLVECLARRLGYRRPGPVVVRPPLPDGAPTALVAPTVARACEVYGELPAAAAAASPLGHWHAVARELQRRSGLVAVLIDDAHTLARDWLEALADLLDSEAARAVVRVLLVGDESVRELVASPPLSYHLGVSCYLEPLEPDEVAAYVAARLFAASGKREGLFTRRALELVAERTGGVPSLIHLVADAALLRAYREHSRRVSRETVELAAAEALAAGGPTTTA